MYEELKDSETSDVLSTTYYEYSGDGNVTRIITKAPSGVGMESMAAASGESASPLQGEGGGEGGGTMALIAPPPPTGGMRYSAVRFGYANNGRAVVFAHSETWTESSGCPTSDYQIPWAREFRCDGARARYMNRPLNVSTLGLDPQPHPTQPTVWTDYDGDETYGDFTVATAGPWTVTNTDSYQPGLWRKIGTTGSYVHSDHLGTLRRLTNSAGALVAGSPRAYTAFGEQVGGSVDRFGYVGAWGYQSNPIPESPNPDTAFPYLHVGARYYDPSSGRFLQRDPIGIKGGLNVYGYVGSAPSVYIDPQGLTDRPPPSWPLPPDLDNDWEWKPNRKNPKDQEHPGHWLDCSGGRWTYHREDPVHNPHWDVQPKEGPKQRVPIGDKPIFK